MLGSGLCCCGIQLPSYGRKPGQLSLALACTYPSGSSLGLGQPWQFCHFELIPEYSFHCSDVCSKCRSILGHLEMLTGPGVPNAPAAFPCTPRRPYLWPGRWPCPHRLSAKWQLRWETLQDGSAVCCLFAGWNTNCLQVSLRHLFCLVSKPKPSILLSLSLLEPHVPVGGHQLTTSCLI